MITGVKSLSTVDIMNLASSQNIELKLISSANSAEIDTLKLDAKSIAEIKAEVANGNFVNVPQENITVNKWTGTTALNVIEKFDTKADEALQKISSIVSKGYDEKTATTLLKDTKFLNYNDDLTYAILKTGKAAEVAETLSKYSDDVIEALNKSPNKDAAISLIAKHGDTAVDIFVKYGDEAVEVIGKYGDDATRIIMDYSDDGFTALKNGVTPKQINEIKEIGLTPNDFSGQGKIRNLIIKSTSDAEEIIKANKKISEHFTFDEVNALKSKALELEDAYKANGSTKQLGPASATVYYKNAPAGENPYIFALNNNKGKSGFQLDESIRIDKIDDKIDELKHPDNINILEAAKEIDGGVGSHAEVNAVREALKKWPDANPEDFLVYVNYTGGNINIPASEKPFYTCAHCKFILQDFNILSNVGNIKYER